MGVDGNRGANLFMGIVPIPLLTSVGAIQIR